MIKIRNAFEEDAMSILAWRNDSLTRSMSRDSDLIDKETHMRWFLKALNDPSKFIYIGEHNNERIGMIRFDGLSENTWEVNLLVNPASRGYGFGYQLLELGINDMKKNSNKLNLKAVIKDINQASLRVFNISGFLPTEQHKNLITFFKSL